MQPPAISLPTSKSRSRWCPYWPRRPLWYDALPFVASPHRTPPPPPPQFSSPWFFTFFPVSLHRQSPRWGNSRKDQTGCSQTSWRICSWCPTTSEERGLHQDRDQAQIHSWFSYLVDGLHCRRQYRWRLQRQIGLVALPPFSHAIRLPVLNTPAHLLLACDIFKEVSISEGHVDESFSKPQEEFFLRQQLVANQRRELKMC